MPMDSGVGDDIFQSLQLPRDKGSMSYKQSVQVYYAN